MFWLLLRVSGHCWMILGLFISKNIFILPVSRWFLRRLTTQKAWSFKPSLCLFEYSVGCWCAGLGFGWLVKTWFRPSFFFNAQQPCPEFQHLSCLPLKKKANLVKSTNTRTVLRGVFWLGFSFLTNWRNALTIWMWKGARGWNMLETNSSAVLGLLVF